MVEMPCGLWTRLGSRNRVLNVGPDPAWEGAVLRAEAGAAHCKV